MGPARLNLDAGGGSGSGGGNNRGGSTVAPGAGALGLDNDDAGHRGWTIGPGNLILVAGGARVRLYLFCSWNFWVDQHMYLRAAGLRGKLF